RAVPARFVTRPPSNASSDLWRGHAGEAKPPPAKRAKRASAERASAQPRHHEVARKGLAFDQAFALAVTAAQVDLVGRPRAHQHHRQVVAHLAGVRYVMRVERAVAAQLEMHVAGQAARLQSAAGAAPAGEADV